MRRDFVMISTDKAVNPTSVMGSCKRLAEQYVQRQSAAELPIRHGALRQRAGLGRQRRADLPRADRPRRPGDRHAPRDARYFMTIPEAAQLVIQAGAMGQGGEIFVLDMGEPVRIVDLAHDMIRLSGLRDGEDIEIQFIGLRPGEKLFEELITEGESILPTYHNKIKIFQGPPVSLSSLEGWLLELAELLCERDEAGLVAHLKRQAPEYQPSNHLAAATEPQP